MKVLILVFLGVSSAARLPRQFVDWYPANQLQSHYPNYLLQNVFQVDPSAPLVATVISDGRPGIAHFQSSFHYFSTPLYDYRIHLSPFYPGFQPVVPSYVPGLPSTTPQVPPSDDGIETLDQTLDPAAGETSQSDDDSVTIDAI